jgi:hypothetical protein
MRGGILRRCDPLGGCLKEGKGAIRRTRLSCRFRDRGLLLLATLFEMYPFLKKLFADGGYQGPVFPEALAKNYQGR